MSNITFGPAEVVNALDQIDALFANHECWSAGSGARNAAGESVNPISADAVAFCMIGASWRINNDSYKHRCVMIAIAAAKNDRGVVDETIGEYNDRLSRDQQGFEGVKSWIAEAKEIARSERFVSLLDKFAHDFPPDDEPVA